MRRSTSTVLVAVLLLATPLAWASDPVEVMPVADINPSGGSLPGVLTGFGDHVYFRADDGETGVELWRTDGETTELVADINPSGSSRPAELMVFGDDLFFQAFEGNTGVELWRTDGKTTELVADINPSGSSFPARLTVFGDHLYFRANDGTGTELWRTDRTITDQVADIDPGIAIPGLFPAELTVLGDHLYFRADDGTTGAELWRTDGETTELLADINPSLSSSPNWLTASGDHLYFSANDGTTGVELWRAGSPLAVEVALSKTEVATGDLVQALATVEGRVDLTEVVVTLHAPESVRSNVDQHVVGELAGGEQRKVRWRICATEQGTFDLFVRVDARTTSGRTVIVESASAILLVEADGRRPCA